MRRAAVVLALLLSTAPVARPQTPKPATPSSTDKLPPQTPTSPVQTPATEGGTAASSSSGAGADPAFLTVAIPETVPEMLSQLQVRDQEIKAFIDRGAFANVYVPAFQAKDLALALDEHKKELPFERQPLADLAIGRLVRFAYILDAYGDLGNRQQIVEAYERFTAAVKDIESAFPRPK